MTGSKPRIKVLLQGSSDRQKRSEPTSCRLTSRLRSEDVLQQPDALYCVLR